MIMAVSRKFCLKMENVEPESCVENQNTHVTFDTFYEKMWCRQTDRGKDRQTNRQAGRHTDSQADRQADTQADRKTDRQTERKTDRQTGR
jgi:hypothetical protein